MTEILIAPTLESLISSCIDHFIAAAAQAVRERGVFSVALSGGSTPLPLYRHLAGTSLADGLAWDRTAFFWGDERPVPPDHPESNYRQAHQLLLEPRAVPPKHIFRVRGELEPESAAALYQQDILDWFKGASPRYDLILLGLGDDGHTASLFPATRVVEQPGKYQWVAANQVPQIDSWRITFTPRLINAARLVIFLVAGESKAEALAAVLEGPCQPERYPAQLIQPASGKLVWLVDQAAGSLLSSSLAG